MGLDSVIGRLRGPAAIDHGVPPSGALEIGVAIDGVSLRRWTLAAICLTAFAFGAPAIDNDFFFDDWGVYFAWLDGTNYLEPIESEALEALNVAMLERGYRPWFASEELYRAMLRPLALASHNLDFTLFAGRRDLMHVHTLLWYVGLVAVMGTLFRRFATSPIAAIAATAFYAFDDAHAMSAGWITARNTIMATTFGALALLAQDRAVRDGVRLGHAACAVALALAFASGEAAVFTLAYLLAHSAFIDRGPVGARVVRAVPWLVVAFAWAAIYVTHGYGARGSGEYIDPARSTLAFIQSAAEMALPSLAAKLSGVGSPDQWRLSATTVPLMAILALVAVPALGTLCRRDSHSRFWLAGLLLALAPFAMCPQDRLFLPMGIGASALLGNVVGGVIGHSPGPALGGSARYATAGLALLSVITHGALSAAAFPIRAEFVQAPPGLDVALLSALDGWQPGQRLVLVNAPGHDTVTAIQMYARVDGRSAPDSIRVLHGQSTPVRMTRLDARALRVQSEAGLYGPIGSARYRRPNSPTPVGHRIALGGATATVVRVDAKGEPTVVDFRFAEELESNAVWKRWDGARFVGIVPPMVGESRLL